MSGTVVIRQAEEHDADGFANVERTLYGDAGTEVYGVDEFHAWRATYPEGFLVAECEGKIVGYSHNLRQSFSWKDIADCRRYSPILGGDKPETHEPNGNSLRGVSLASIRKGTGRQLFDATFALADRLGLDHYFSFSRLSGFAGYVADLQAQRGRPLDEIELSVAARAYAVFCAKLIEARIWPTMEAVDGNVALPLPKASDPVLAPHLKRQERYGLATVLDHCMQDPPSLGFGALCVRV